MSNAPRLLSKAIMLAMRDRAARFESVDVTHAVPRFGMATT
jgi:hypothetical protein